MIKEPMAFNKTNEKRKRVWEKKNQQQKSVSTVKLRYLMEQRYVHSAEKKQGPGGCLTAIIIVVVIGLIGSCFGGSKSKEETPSNATATTTPSNNSNQKEETTAPESTVAEKTNFDVGEVADIKGVQVSLLGTTESKGSDFLKPDEGNIFVLCEFEISNNSDKDISVSSMMSFEAYCDDYSVTQDILGLQAPEGKGKNQLDGSVAAGKKMNGVIAYQVPEDWKTLEIKFSPSFWSNKSATFVATK